MCYYQNRLKMMPQDHLTRVLLQIKGQNIAHLIEYAPDNDVLRISSQLSYAASACPRCD
ncbi:protein of unknown function [Lactiplantibacillus plantarum]